MGFLERKRKIKRKCKFIFGRKRKKSRKWPNSPFSAPEMKTHIDRLRVWWLDLTDPDPLRFYVRSTPLGAQPRYCVRTTASRGLSAIVEFLVLFSKWAAVKTTDCLGCVAWPAPAYFHRMAADLFLYLLEKLRLGLKTCFRSVRLCLCFLNVPMIILVLWEVTGSMHV